MSRKQSPAPFDNFNTIDSKIVLQRQFLRKSSSARSLITLPNNEFDSPNQDDWHKFQSLTKRIHDVSPAPGTYSSGRRQSEPMARDEGTGSSRRRQSEPAAIPLTDVGGGQVPVKSPADSGSEDEEESGEDDGAEYQWDVARNVPWEEVSPSEACLPCLKALKVVVYFILLLIILLCSVVAQASMLLLFASLVKPTQDDAPYRENGIKQLIWITCIPHVCVFIISFLKSSFGNYSWPSCGQFFVILTLELLHIFGLTLLIFRVLSAFDSLYALGLTYAICTMPTIVKIIFARRSHSDVCSTVACIFTFLLDGLCLAVQLGAVGYSVYQLMSSGAQTSNTFRWATSSSIGFAADKSRNFYWQIPLALVLVSVKWWENFVDTDRGCLRLFAFKRVCKDARTKMDTVTSLVSIVATIGLVYLLEYLDGKTLTYGLLYGYSTTNGTSAQAAPSSSSSSQLQAVPLANGTVASPASAGNVSTPFTITLPDINWEIAVGIAQALAGAIGYISATLACKLRMQQVSFCFPVYLATPVVAMLVALQCSGIMPSLPIFGRLQYEMICPVSYSQHYLQLTASGIYWLSALWLTSYVWFPKAERLAFSEKLWVKSLFIGPLAVPSFLMNRRRNDLELRRTREGTYIFSSGTPSGSTENLDDSEDTQDTSVDSDTPVTPAGEEHPVPMIYACATMWHEEEDEMKALFKSIFRMDKDQCIRRLAKETFKTNDPDYYEFEAHILFDDCMELNDDDKWVANKYVRQVAQCLHEAASLVSKEQKEMPPPTRIPTPYGGRLTWKLPGGNNLIIHLKDKNKIRHRKRWSQCMYMYYLLGYRLFEEYQNDTRKGGVASSVDTPQKPVMAQSRSALAKAQATFGYFAKSEILNTMDENTIAKAANTFVLALDGDVDFKPDAVRLLVDQMKRNPKTGAACGRIHPTGSGPMVWYQLFEYAIGHWFQKATEHILGCVLCSPGCFSLFRGLALLDDNVMKMYTKNVEKATDYLQCDQGEDRWLCTLLLKQGHRVDYTAAADALTHAPEGFDEFFNQRRRWMPSTMANIMDLLGDWQITVRVNDNISYFYIVYQFLLMISTILGPATIILAVAQAFLTIFSCDILVAYAMAISPVIIYILICFYFKPKTQLLIAKVLCAVFAAVMLGVLVGTLHVIVTAKNLDPGFIFLALLTFSFIFAGAMHPYEFFCLTHGILYFLSVPAGYLILVIYSLSNMNSVSWGTREVARRKTPAELKAEEEKKKELEKKKAKKKGWCSFFNVQAIMAEIKEFIVQLMPQKSPNTVSTEDESLKTQRAILKQIKGLMKTLKKQAKKEKNSDFGSSDSDSDSDDDGAKKAEEGKAKAASALPAPPPPAVPAPPAAPAGEVGLDDIDDPDWLKYSEDLGDGNIERLSDGEREFWVKFIRKYLKPLDKDKKHEEEMKKKLAELRTSSSMAFWFINFLWVLLSFMLNKDNALNTVSFVVAGTKMTTQPFGFVFLLFFVIVLILQLIAMVMHRWGTFMQLMSITELARPRWLRKLDRKSNGAKLMPSASEAISIVEKLVNGGFDSPSGGFDSAFDPPSVQKNDKSGRSNHRSDFSPEDIYKTIRGLQAAQADDSRESRKGGHSGGKSLGDDQVDPFGVNNPRRRYARAGDRGRDGHSRPLYDRHGEGQREGRRSRAAQRSGYHSRRFASGDQFAANFQRQLGTIMQRRRRDY